MKKTTYKFSPVREIRRDQIVLRPELFQGRSGAFAQETVDKIIREGYDKSRDPIVVWQNEKGAYLLISGHSRFEAARRLFDQGQADLATLPVKVFQGTMEEALDFALLESNRSGTREGLASDLKAYKRARQRGFNRNYLSGIFKPEGYLRLLERIAHLDENGKFLAQLGTDSQKHFPFLQRNAGWVGMMRKSIPVLTNAHEKELFDFLYPLSGLQAHKAKRRLITRDDFFQRVSKRVSRIDFDPEKPLNLEKRIHTNALTDPARARIAELDKEVEGYRRKIDQLDERIVLSRKADQGHRVEIHKKKQQEYSQLIIKALEEKQKIEEEIGLLEKHSVFDLFSQGPDQELTGKKTGAPLPQAKVLPLLCNDKWFENHPEKILGQQIQVNRFGKHITGVKGSLPQAIALMQNPPASSGGPHLENALRLSLHQQAAHPDTRTSDGLLSFQEVLSTYNPEISEEELRVWVWCRLSQNRYNHPEVIHHPENGWSAYILSQKEAKARLPEWLESGLVCLHQDRYLPAVLYYSENIHRRLEDLQSNQSEVESKQGKAQYQRQRKGLEAILPGRLLLDAASEDERLFIHPQSQFAKETRITQLANGTEFSKSKNLPTAFLSWLKQVPITSFNGSSADQVEAYFIMQKQAPRDWPQALAHRIKRAAKQDGLRLFAQFLAKGLILKDQQAIEKAWNARYNGYVEPNYNKIPVAFSCSRTFKNHPLSIRKTQREGIAFLSAQGSGCLAHGVGLGKTMAGILALGMAIESGQCRRPLIVVPNATYANWLEEIRGKIENGKVVQTGLLPQYPVNDLYNLSRSYRKHLIGQDGKVGPVAPASISILTYEGFNQLGFSESSESELGQEFYRILNQGNEKKRQQASLQERIGELMGRGVVGSLLLVEDLGFDYLLIDEAHNLKKSFTRVRGEVDQKGKRSRTPYKIDSGQPSMIGLRGFMIANYIMRRNGGTNVSLLTATPFTNHPLEIYSMLALVAFSQLEKEGITNIKQFFDLFVRSTNELVINARLQPQRRDVILGFNNLVSMQQLIFRYFHFREGNQAGILRPEKHTLPVILQPTAEQAELMELVESYVRGEADLEEVCPTSQGFEETTPATSSQLYQPGSQEEAMVRILRGLAFAQQIALSPYLFACRKYQEPDPAQYVKSSPKLQYVMGCIDSVRKHAALTGEEMPGQVIYANAGVGYFPLLLRYLCEHLGFAKDQVGMITGGMNARKKNAIRDQFLSGKIKVLLGSATIREGINLQYTATDIYNLWLDWNPLDLRQLEGRIWRQGNRYGNVRINIPLLKDSVDIFKFQKIEEKTSRINEIWYQEGRKNVLDLHQLNPAKLKAALISDPATLAEIEMVEIRENINQEIAILDNQKALLKAYHQARDKFQKHFPKVLDMVDRHRPQRPGGRSRNEETILRLMREIIDDDQVTVYENDRLRLTKCRKAWRSSRLGLRDVVLPLGYEADFDYEHVASDLDRQIQRHQDRIHTMTGPAALSKRTAQIIRERNAREKTSLSFEQQLDRFSKLNKKVISELLATPDRQAIEKLRHTSAQILGEDDSKAELEQMQALLADMETFDRLQTELQLLAAS